MHRQSQHGVEWGDWGGEPSCENILNKFQIYFETHIFLLETLVDRNKLTDYLLVKTNLQSEY